MRERGQDEHTSLRGDMTKAKGRRKQYIQRRIRLGENSGEIQREKNQGQQTKLKTRYTRQETFKIKQELTSTEEKTNRQT